MEPHARRQYAEHLHATVVTTGLVVCHKNPWLACTPDGVVVQDRVPARLLEIKCPTMGKTSGILETLKACKFLTKNDQQWLLKKRHSYYGQVQLYMSILNVSVCDFMIFASSDNSFLTIQVPFDATFTWTLLTRLKDVYFKHIIPILAQSATS